MFHPLAPWLHLGRAAARLRGDIDGGGEGEEGQGVGGRLQAGKLHKLATTWVESGVES